MLQKKCGDVKASASIFSSAGERVQFTGVYKLTGEQGKIGGQIWYKANNNFWIGAESVANFKGDGDHELMIAGDFVWENLNIVPYLAFYIKTEHIGGLGVKTYNEEQTLSFGLEYKVQGPTFKGHDFFTYFGLAFNPADILKALQQIKTFFGGQVDIFDDYMEEINNQQKEKNNAKTTTNAS